MFSRHWYCWAGSRNWYDFPFLISRHGNSHWHTIKRFSVCLYQFCIAVACFQVWASLEAPDSQRLRSPIGPIGLFCNPSLQTCTDQVFPPIFNCRPMGTTDSGSVWLIEEGLWALPFDPDTRATQNLAPNNWDTDLSHSLTRLEFHSWILKRRIGHRGTIKGPWHWVLCNLLDRILLQHSWQELTGEMNSLYGQFFICIWKNA